MQQRRFRSLLPILVFLGIFGLTACSKKMAKVTQPSAPPPVAPTATLSARPDVIQQGQSTVLTWQTTNATDITLEGVGIVGSSGSQSVSPSASRTYTLIAKGAGGTSQALARITVNPASAAAAAVLPTDSELFMKNMRDVFFNFDDSRIRQDQGATTEKDASFLSQHPNLKILIEGHCDDRGSEIYNLALGESRASTVKEALIRQGIDPSRIATISYGKEKPFCTQDNETCWQENRRDHIVPKQ